MSNLLRSILAVFVIGVICTFWYAVNTDNQEAKRRAQAFAELEFEDVFGFALPLTAKEGPTIAAQVFDRLKEMQAEVDQAHTAYISYQNTNRDILTMSGVEKFEQSDAQNLLQLKATWAENRLDAARKIAINFGFFNGAALQ